MRDDAARLVEWAIWRATDRHKLAEYLDAARDVEKAHPESGGAAARPNQVTTTMDLPAGDTRQLSPITCDLMIDLQVLAMQADITRTGTFMIGREISNRTYAEIGVPDSHHMLSHHGHNPDKMAKLAQINRYHMEFFAYFLQATARDQGWRSGTLLDTTHAAARLGLRRFERS